MSKTSKLIAMIALFAAAWSAPACARGTGHNINGAKYYGPVYGWRYYPPPAQAVEPACNWTMVRTLRNGHSVTRRVRHCS
jgi:hypothetical protein